jgi:hypothetical protein
MAARILAALTLICWWPARAETEKRPEGRVRMRDGVHLSTSVYLPASTGKHPAILVRTPYGKGKDLTTTQRAFVDRGYAVVTQDVRGRHESEGVFGSLRQETDDGDDTIRWIAAQGWSDGKVGMIGGSYLGIVQWKAAISGNPHLKAIFPQVSGCDDYADRFYSRGGAMKLGHRLLWMSENLRAQGFPKPDFAKFVLSLPLRSADVAATGQRSENFYQQAIAHPSYDDFWKSLSTRERLGRVNIPVFSVGGWYDNFVEGDLEAFTLLAGKGKLVRTLIGPWAHNMAAAFEGVDFGPQAAVAVTKLQLEWFDHWLKQPKPAREYRGAPLRIFVMGRNEWRDEQEWPLRHAVATNYYLASRGKANTLKGDGKLQPKPPRSGKPDAYTYDPRSPAPTRGGAVCCNPKVFPWGPMDQRPVEARPDVLVYTSAPLKQNLEVTGPVRVNLWVSTSAPDTDFTAKLVDVFPNGTARNLCDGILRLRYRNGLGNPVLVKPGEVMQVTVDAGVTSNMFLKGHRVRVEISSSNFPRFDRNLNTGRANASETELRTAHNVVYHDRQRASHVVLPVVFR